ncbi:hypothetical protein ENUP19_0111G0013 [Entamoeba nuttalli]|uniref:Biotin-protein ligase N-terminal domain-containing protein n=1 Tax=Entamoeba nuttalli TaxID=412467 RepID=A0ABQ0DI71_9EUKA
MTIKSIVIYADEGTIDVCVYYSIKMLHSQYQEAQIRKICANELIEGKWIYETDLFVMPGGADRVEVLKEFINGGGKYLGICAGAYFASSFIEFNKDVSNELTLCEERTLKLFNGIAHGPMYQGFEEYSERGAVIIPIYYQNNEKVEVYYNGGCSFVDNLNQYKESHFLAKYSNGMNALFFDIIGKGKVILSGPHFELDIEWCGKMLKEKIKTSQWVECTDLLVIPEGEDLPYLDKLQMDGIELIKSFVLNGGKFLGICAGAYFSSSYIKFNANSQLPIEGERYLKFYEGNAIGPVYDGYQPNSESGARIIKIKYNNSYAYVYYNGGCYFDDNNNKVEGTYFALYEDGKTCGYTRRYGKGKILITGFHFEFDEQCCSHLLSQLRYDDFELRRESLIRYILSLLSDC